MQKLGDKIKSKEDYETAASLVKALKDLGKLAKVEKDKIIVPLNEAMAAAKNHFKPFEIEIFAIENFWKARIIEYVDSQKSKALKAADAVDAGKLNVGNYAKKVQGLEDSIQVSAASNRTIQQLVIVDESKIPREYLMPNGAAIKAALKDGKKVAGCKLEDKTTISI